MKLKLLAVFIFGILILNLVSSVDIEIKDNVKKGENLVVKVSGNFVKPLTIENVKFYRRHMDTSMGIFNLEKIEGDYYFYLKIPLEKEADNYSISLENIEYRVGNKILNDTISKNFTIVNETVPFSISPPLLITNSSYEVTLMNLLPTKIEISLEKNINYNQSTSSGVSPISSNKSEGFFDIFFNLFKSTNSSKEVSNQTNSSQSSSNLKNNSTKIILSSGEIKTIEYPAPEKKGFNKLELYYNGEGYGVLVYSLSEHEDLKINDTENITLIEGNCSSSNLTKCFSNESCVGNVTYFINETCCSGVCAPIEEIDIETENCSVKNWKVCNISTEKCSGNITYTKTQACCTGECVKLKKSNSGKTIGWVIIIIIILFLLWFLKRKYMRAKPEKVNLLKIAKKGNS